ncbi:DUF4124 domain-containing protein [Wenzhouxiangella sp. XN79A]|uniref:DUF4124 domain-containing protein n=1 Tax=Wenzhouxiangella sp. XN79A TaxID=2724193 RepID=UPI00144AC301|nr:DUF4124 domain-containing protein [Wenzhouxiangella sp. XN79A]NKI35276.1 DUF4124 domain-containing protein [Wenzhouxiangella sp. XN79A]
MQHLAWGFGLALLLAGSPTIYEWIDEDGNRHFSDREPDVAGWSERVIDEQAISTYRAPDHPAPQRRRHAEPPDDANEAPSTNRSASPFSPDPNQHARCTRLLNRIDAIQDELRAGYREPRGQRLRDRRRELREAYRKECD